MARIVLDSIAMTKRILHKFGRIYIHDGKYCYFNKNTRTYLYLNNRPVIV